MARILLSQQRWFGCSPSDVAGQESDGGDQSELQAGRYLPACLLLPTVRPRSAHVRVALSDMWITRAAPFPSIRLPLPNVL